jgi:hypothetical protein
MYTRHIAEITTRCARRVGRHVWGFGISGVRLA